MNSEQILEREFLVIRAKILEVGAALDRIDRASGDVSNDANWEQLRKAISLIHDDNDSADRAEQIQLLFSRQYVAGWTDDFKLSSR